MNWKQHCTNNKKQPRSSKLARLKMTTPCKAKTAATFRRQPKNQESPRTLNLKTTQLKPKSNLLTQNPEESQRNFISLLSRWENISSTALTPSVQTMPRSRPKAEGQSQKVLQNTFEKLEKTFGTLLDGKFDYEEV